MINEGLKVIFKTIKECIDNIALPNGKNLVPACVICIIIFITSTISFIFGLYPLIHPVGAGLAVVIMLVVVSMERRSNSEILRLYRATELCVEKVKSRKPRASSDSGHSGDSAGNKPGDEEDEG